MVNSPGSTSVSNPYASPANKMVNRISPSKLLAGVGGGGSGSGSPIKFGPPPKHYNRRLRRVCMWVAFALIEKFVFFRLYHNLLLTMNKNGMYNGNINANGKSNGNDNVNSYASPGRRNAFLDEFGARMEDTASVDSARRTTTEEEYEVNINQMSKEEKKHLIVYERGYPKNTHFVDYQTAASEREIEKHDRMLVQGFYFMKTHDFSKYVNFNQHTLKEEEKRGIRAAAAAAAKGAGASQSENDSSSSSSSSSKICVNIYVCNRRIPYINALIMGLTAYSTPELQQKYMPLRTYDETTGKEKPHNEAPYAQFHFLNTEKRPQRLHFKYMRETLSKLPFIHSVHNITYRDEIYDTEETNKRELIFREMFISDEISGLKICLESGLKYCLMMEEDAVVPVDFLHLVETHVIQPLERANEEISVLSLYSYYNLVFFGPNRLNEPKYSKMRYEKDRSKENSERFSHNLPPYAPLFHIREKEYKYGTVAMMYTRESAQKLVTYLQKVGVDPIHNADEFMNAPEYFPEEMGVPRKHVQPSLINHIGYYSERMADVKSRGMFSQLNTDVRFMFDAGEEVRESVSESVSE